MTTPHLRTTPLNATTESFTSLLPPQQYYYILMHYTASSKSFLSRPLHGNTVSAYYSLGSARAELEKEVKDCISDVATEVSFSRSSRVDTGANYVGNGDGRPVAVEFYLGEEMWKAVWWIEKVVVVR